MLRTSQYVWRIHKTNPGASAPGPARILSKERLRPQQLEQDRTRGSATPARRGHAPHLGQATRPQTRLGRLAQILRLRCRGFRPHPRLHPQDEKLVAQLPVFFRTLFGQKPSREDLEKLVELIRSANRP